MSERFVRIPNIKDYLAGKRDRERRAYKNFVSYWSSINSDPSQLNPSIVERSLNEARVTPDWYEELANLRSLIDETRSALEAQDPIALRGFNEIIDGLNRLPYSGQPTLPEIAVGILASFEDSYKKYSAFNQRPLQNNSKGLRRYKRLSNTLTPRGIRLFVKSLGLNGRTESPEDLTKSEGYSGLSATNNAIDDARRKVNTLLLERIQA